VESSRLPVEVEKVVALEVDRFKAALGRDVTRLLQAPLAPRLVRVQHELGSAQACREGAEVRGWGSEPSPVSFPGSARWLAAYGDCRVEPSANWLMLTRAGPLWVGRLSMHGGRPVPPSASLYCGAEAVSTFLSSVMAVKAGGAY